MNEVRKADPEARRRAVLIVVFATAVGGLLIAGFEHLREPFREWLVSEPAETARRARLAIYVAAVVLSAPVIAFAAYLWLLGARTVRAQQFPPPGVRVVRDTPVVGGRGAVTRGHAIQVIAACLGLGFGVMWIFFLWLARTAGQGGG
jgi:hypothetical protein